jgi:hypothetical protein
MAAVVVARLQCVHQSWSFAASQPDHATRRQANGPKRVFHQFSAEKAWRSDNPPFQVFVVQDSSNQTSLLNERQTERPTAAKTGMAAAFLCWLRRTVPSLFVFAALGGLLVWGQHTGWTMPKFSSLRGDVTDGKDDWCSEHSVAESQCVECNPELLAKPMSYGWCKRHGVHECPLEHPEVAQTEVRPQVSADDLERAQRALDFTERP